jgi:uncharacterized membrane protein
MLVPIPIGLWVFSFICDLVFAGGGRETWHVVAYYTMAGGVIGALIAAVPGFIDMLSLRAETKKTALIHMTVNLTIVVLYLVNIWLRSRGAVSDAATIWLSFISIVLLLISGWLGGKMVYVQGVAVEAAPEGEAAPRREVHA